jgi:hypothetical protein
MATFYQIVIMTAIVVLLLSLILVGIFIHKTKGYNYGNAAQCPDGFLVYPVSKGTDGTYTYECVVPTAYASTFDAAGTGNVYKFQNGSQTAKLGQTASNTNAGGAQTINFNDGMWSGKAGACLKYQWATNNGAGKIFNWDGITNVRTAC